MKKVIFLILFLGLPMVGMAKGKIPIQHSCALDATQNAVRQYALDKADRKLFGLNSIEKLEKGSFEIPAMDLELLKVKRVDEDGEDATIQDKYRWDYEVSIRDKQDDEEG